jgi:hypothetical protein
MKKNMLFFIALLVVSCVPTQSTTIPSDVIAVCVNDLGQLF